MLEFFATYSKWIAINKFISVPNSKADFQFKVPCTNEETTIYYEIVQNFKLSRILSELI